MGAANSTGTDHRLASGRPRPPQQSVLTGDLTNMLICPGDSLNSIKHFNTYIISATFRNRSRGEVPLLELRYFYSSTSYVHAAIYRYNFY